MVRYQLETDKEQEIIIMLCNYKVGDVSIIEKLSTLYDFSKKEDYDNFFKNVESACSICHQQSHYIPKLIVDILDRIKPGERILLKQSLFEAFSHALTNIDDDNIAFSTFSGNCIREKLLDPKSVLDEIIRFYQTDEGTNYVSYKIDISIIQILFCAGDILSDAFPNETKKLLRKLSHRGYPVKRYFAKNFWISRSLNTPGIQPFCDYYCFKYDDVEYLQKLAADPNFDKNRPYMTPIWEWDLIFTAKPSLISAAAFYGAEKCFRYLLLSGATLNADNPDGQRNRFNTFGFGRGFGRFGAILPPEPSDEEVPMSQFYVQNAHGVLQNFMNMRGFRPSGELDVGDYAIAGNNFSLLHLIEQNAGSILSSSPLMIAAAYNRISQYQWLKSKSSNENQTHTSLLGFVLQKDNSCFMRYILKHNLFDVPIVFQQSSFCAGTKCFLELATFYRGTPYFNQVLSSAVIGRNTLDELFKAYVNVCNSVFSSAFNDENLDFLRMQIHKKTIELIDRNDPNSFDTSIAKYSISVIKEFLQFKELVEYMEKSGKSFLFTLIIANRFDAVSYVFSQDVYRKKYTLKTLLSITNSIEMRKLLKEHEDFCKSGFDSR